MQAGYSMHRECQIWNQSFTSQWNPKALRKFNIKYVYSIYSIEEFNVTIYILLMALSRALGIKRKTVMSVAVVR